MWGSTLYVWEAYVESWGVVTDGGSKRVGGGLFYILYYFFLFLEIHISMTSVINNTVALSPGELSCTL